MLVGSAPGGGWGRIGQCGRREDLCEEEGHKQACALQSEEEWEDGLLARLRPPA